MPVYPPLSVVIISLNEEQRIGDCLASVRDLTDDVVVVDAHSRDQTVEIAAAAGARIVRRAWTGYSDQKNFGNALANHDWILSLDADERVTPELADSIRAELARESECAAYEIRFENYFGSSRVRFGAWNPESHVRLFDRRKFRWNCDEVHEGLGATQCYPVGKLAGPIRHFTVDSPSLLAVKTDRYSALFAEKLRRQGRRPSWVKIWLNPAYRFTRDYVFRGGLLDGHAGLLIACESARYTHLKYRLAVPPEAPRDRNFGWLTPLTATVAVLPIVAAIFLGSRPAKDESRQNTVVTPTHSIAMPANDGFDNNPIVASGHALDDDDVLI